VKRYPDLMMAFVGPVEVWLVLDTTEFRLPETHPDGESVEAVGIAPMNGRVLYGECRQLDGTSMSRFQVQGINSVEVGGEVKVTLEVAGVRFLDPEEMAMDEIRELRKRLLEEQQEA
jgi:hypothetical protein